MATYFLDTEFNEFGGDLISLALVRAHSDNYLYVATECEKPGAWVAENVIPIIDAPGADAVRILPTSFGRFIADFLDGDPYPVIVSDWPDDIRYFCQALKSLSMLFLIVQMQVLPTSLGVIWVYSAGLIQAIQTGDHL